MMQCCGKLMGEDTYCRVCGGTGTFAHKGMCLKNKTVYICPCKAITIPGDVFCGRCGKPTRGRIAP